MTESAKALIETDIRIIDLAILYHFQSQEAFTRAFKKICLMTPGQYRRLLKDIYKYKDIEEVKTLIDYSNDASISFKDTS